MLQPSSQLAATRISASDILTGLIRKPPRYIDVLTLYSVLTLCSVLSLLRSANFLAICQASCDLLSPLSGATKPRQTQP